MSERFPDSPVHVVTGAASGIGREVVARLTARGDKVVMLVRSEDQVDELAKAFPTYYSIHPLDLSDSRAVAEWAGELGTGKPAITRVNSLIHSAGVVRLGRVDEADDRTWHRHLDVNLVAPALLTKGLLPLLRSARGTVVFVNSTSGLNASAEWSAYAASKFGLRAVADSLRAEEPEIRVSSVFPSRTATKMQREVHEMEGREYDASNWIQPGTVADAIVGLLDLPGDATVPELVIRPTR